MRNTSLTHNRRLGFVQFLATLAITAALHVVLMGVFSWAFQKHGHWIFEPIGRAYAAFVMLGVPVYLWVQARSNTLLRQVVTYVFWSSTVWAFILISDTKGFVLSHFFTLPFCLLWPHNVVFYMYSACTIY